MNASLMIPYLALGQSKVKQHTKIPHHPELAVLARDIPNIILQDKAPNTQMLSIDGSLGQRAKACKPCQLRGMNLHYT
mgnify:CR=1 FL=1